MTTPYQSIFPPKPKVYTTPLRSYGTKRKIITPLDPIYSKPADDEQITEKLEVPLSGPEETPNPPKRGRPRKT